jgi:DNA-directed RNA polymerase specialized sigma24 family protein
MIVGKCQRLGEIALISACCFFIFLGILVTTRSAQLYSHQVRRAPPRLVAWEEAMDRKSLESLYLQYKHLIEYVAYTYKSSVVDVDDVIQEGCMFLVEYFSNHTMLDPVALDLFKKSLFWRMRSFIIQQVRSAHPRGRSMVRLTSDRHLDSRNFVHIDDIIAVSDMHVLARIYAVEFLSELRRVLHGTDAKLLGWMVKSVNDGQVPVEWAREAATALGISQSAVYNHIVRIRDAAVRALARVA